MVVKAEILYKVIFQSKYEDHSQIEVKYVLSTGIWFFCFSPDIWFSEKNFLGFLLLRFVSKDVRGWGRNGSKVQIVGDLFTIEYVFCF